MAIHQLQALLHLLPPLTDDAGSLQSRL